MGLGEGEGDEEDGGGEREAGPGGEGSEPAGAEEAEGEGDLAAGGAGERLGEGDDLGVGLGGAPAAAGDELGVEVAEVGDGTAEGEAAETQEGEEDLERGAGFGRWCGRGHRLGEVYGMGMRAVSRRAMPTLATVKLSRRWGTRFSGGGAPACSP